MRESTLTTQEIESICNIISPKAIRAYFTKNPNGFSKIQSGFRPNALSDEKIVSCVTKNIDHPFISSFIKRRMDSCLQQLEKVQSKLQQEGDTPEESLLRALPESDFCEDVDLFFKICNEDYSPEYAALVKAALAIQANVKQDTTELQGEREYSATDTAEDELSAALNQLRIELESEKVSHGAARNSLAESTAAMDVLRQELDEASAQIALLEQKNQLIQAELNQFNQISKYADIESEETYNDAYPYTSICQVYLNYEEEPRLFRLADIKNGKITLFRKNEDETPFWGNRDRLFWANGPKEKGAIGVWQWNAEPNKSNPDTDYVTTLHNEAAQVIEVLELAECHTYEDLSRALTTTSFPAALGRKMLFVCQNTDRQVIGLLCSERDFDVIAGSMKLKSTVYTLPMFEILSADILTLAGKQIYGFTSLGMPQGLFEIKKPLAVVKETIIQRATSSALRQQGLSKKEAQNCQVFLRTLPCETIYQEIADAYSCSESKAQEYVAAFIAQADTYITADDIDLKTLAAALKRDAELVEKCKNLLTSEWEAERSKELQGAQKQLEEVECAVAVRRAEIVALENDYSSLQVKKVALQAEMEAQTELACAVEAKVEKRIAAARKNAADFICEMAFSSSGHMAESPVPASASTSDMLLDERSINCVPGEDISDIDSFIDELTENLKCIGYSETVAVSIAETIAFCMESGMPVVCGTNAHKIADCVAAMFDGSGAFSVMLSINQPNCTDICAAIQQKAANKKCVVVIGGAFDGLSLHAFNEIILRFEAWENAILIFSLNSVDAIMVPGQAWNLAMFVDGDFGLDNIETKQIVAHHTALVPGTRCTAGDIAEKRKQLKPLTSVVSHIALLNYAKYMAITNSSLKDDTQILLQITLHALSSARKELLLEKLSSMGINIEENKELTRYL